MPEVSRFFGIVIMMYYNDHAPPHFHARYGGGYSEGMMLKDVIEVRALGDYRVHLRFEDGVEGELDLERMIRFTGVFATLRDKTEFARVRVDPEAGTIVWPNGADLDPDVLYAAVTGKSVGGKSGDRVGSP